MKELCRKSQPLTNRLSAAVAQGGGLPAYIAIEITADPTNDFQAAVATNDFRFIGYTGYALVVPGVTNHSLYEKPNGVKIIAGTSDVVSPTTFPAAVAQRYAAAYNALLLQQVGVHQKH